MIVNPQFFSYRLTIGVLVIAFAALATFSYVNYKSVKSDRDFIDEEKKLLQGEISEIITSYNKLETNNDSLNLKLDKSLAVIEITSDSIKKLKTTSNLVSRNRLKLPVENNETIIIENDSLSNAKDLIEDEDLSLAVEEENTETDTASPELSIIEDSFKAKAYQSKNSRLFRTTKASRVNKIQVCFTLPYDTITDKEHKSLYIQVIDPNSNIVSDKGAVRFGEQTLIYSLKTNAIIDYKKLKICEDVFNENRLIKGVYYVNVFEDANYLGSTTIELN
ncbi:hypothetical protein D7030_07830 [Flavobacteriaceae bacterium AU392]|nr:hypothetical protein D1817_00585 [Flavobacteriaceae bacterium]RKM85032.1 hypothetical protein D7030_07830 [Flavobacteriaceae bacterium AU392]